MARRNRHNRRRRRGRFAFLYQVLCLVVILSAVLAALTIFFKADHVKVAGAEHYTEAEVIEASGVKMGSNLYLINKYDVAENINQNLSYVESVRIHRELPDTLCIDIVECKDQVAIEQNGKAWKICTKGKIVDCLDPKKLEKDTTIVTGLQMRKPQLGRSIVVPEKEALARQQLLELLGQLREKKMLPDVQEIHLEDPNIITIRYLDRFNVEFLWEADFDYKLNFLRAVVDKLEDYEKGTLKLTGDGEARFIME